MSERPMNLHWRVGVMGHRSWIAQRLMAGFGGTNICMKARVEEADYVLLDCLYLFAGRSKGSTAEMTDELGLCQMIARIPIGRLPRRLVYLSSLDAYGIPGQMSEYGRFKLRCEMVLEDGLWGRCALDIVRAPAVFGPSQPIDSGMLVPSLAREGEGLEVRNPDRSSTFIYVEDLVDHLIGFADPGNHIDPSAQIPGSFVTTPARLRSLWGTWESYRSLQDH